MGWHDKRLHFTIWALIDQLCLVAPVNTVAKLINIITPQSIVGILNKLDDLSTELLKRLVTDLHTVKDFSTEVLDRFVGRMYSYETSKVFLDVGTSETYEQANN